MPTRGRRRFTMAGLLLSAMGLALAVPAGGAWAGSPELRNLLPVAGQRGGEVRVNFYGPRLGDATEVLFHTPGITFKDIEKKDGDRIEATLMIAPDAPLGEHQLRIVTATGVSEMQTFQVVAQPIVDEDEEHNNSFDEPQAIEAGTIVRGRIKREDVDYFVIEAKKGQRLSVEVNSIRLGRDMSDLYLAVLDERRFEVAAVDDTALLTQDPFISILVPEDGKYTIVVRDSAYQGGDNQWYLLNVGSFPRPAAVYPAGGQPGQILQARFIGDPGGDFVQEVTLPDHPDEQFGLYPERDGQRAPSAHRMRITPEPNVLEGDYSANNRQDQLKDAAASPVPVAFNGIISEAGEHDYFKFSARKGQKLRFDCYASRIGSPLDPVINIYNAADGKHFEGNDDRNGPDSFLEWSVPEDGEYFVRVRDHLGRGGADFVYRLEVGEERRGLTVSMTANDRNRVQQRQAIAIPQGNRFATLMRVNRDRVGGELDVLMEGLPEGVTFGGSCPDGRGEMPVVFEADPTAPMGFRVIDLLAASQPNEQGERVVGGMSHMTPMVIGSPNQTEYYHSELNTIPVAVTKPAPFRIDAVQPAAPLVKDGKMGLRVNVTRDEGYEGKVRLFMLWRPPGIGAEGRIELEKDQNEARYEINADGGAPARSWPMVIIAQGDAPGGPVWVSTQLFEVAVSEPYIKGSIDMAACEKGSPVQVVVKLEHPQAWEGEAQLRLLGLPAETSVEPVTIKPGQEQAVFTVTTTDKTPEGQHKSLLCEIDIPVNGETATHRFGMGGTLRVDRPRPQQQAQETPQPKPEETPQQPQRQLSRLEQLRLEAERERKGSE